MQTIEHTKNSLNFHTYFQYSDSDEVQVLAICQGATIRGKKVNDTIKRNNTINMRNEKIKT